MPKRVRSLSGACFASGDTAVSVWKEINSTIEDIEAVRALEAPSFPQEPDSFLSEILQKYRSLPPEFLASKSISLADQEEKIRQDQARREISQKVSWVTQKHKELAVRLERWDLKLLEQAEAAKQIHEIGQLSEEEVGIPFAFWLSRPYGSKLSGASFREEHYRVQRDFQLPS